MWHGEISAPVPRYLEVMTAPSVFAIGYTTPIALNCRKFASRRSITTRGSAVGGVCARHAPETGDAASAPVSKPPRAITEPDLRARFARTLPLTLRRPDRP